MLSAARSRSAITSSVRHQVHPHPRHTVAIHDRVSAKTFSASSHLQGSARLKGVRIGAVGARPNAFNTTASREAFEASASRQYHHLSKSSAMRAGCRDDPRVRQRIEQIAPTRTHPRSRRSHPAHGKLPSSSMTGCSLSALRPPPSSAGVVQKTSASTSAHYVDDERTDAALGLRSRHRGVVGMYALQLAGGRPSAWSIGTTTTETTPTSASSSTAATGQDFS